MASAPRPAGKSRVYRSELRQQQAEQTKARILTAAVALFAEHGFARTTLAKIAAAAGVSPETVQAHGPKAALMIAAVEFAGVGVAGEKTVLNLDVGRRFVASRDRDQALDLVATTLLEIHRRTAPLAPALFGAAAVDHELESYVQQLVASINRQVRSLLEIADGRGWLREDLPFDELVETMAVLSSVETYLRITQRDGWTEDRFRSWYRRVLAENVFR